MSMYETFGEVKREVAVKLGHISASDAGDEIMAAIGRVANQILRHMHNVSQFKWLREHKNYSLAELSDVDGDGATVGATVAAGGTTVTIDAGGTAEASWLGRDILLGTSMLPYTIIDVSGDDLTIEPAYSGDALTKDDYELYHTHLTLPDDFNVPIKVINITEHYELKPMDITELRRRTPNPWAKSVSGQPALFCVDGRLNLSSPGASANARPYRMFLVPVNSGTADIEVLYYRFPTEMTADADIPDVPPEFRQYLTHGTFVECAQTFGNKDPRSLMMSVQMWKEGLQAMKSRPKQLSRPIQLGSTYDVSRCDILGNLTEYDIYDDQIPGFKTSV